MTSLNKNSADLFSTQHLTILIKYFTDQSAIFLSAFLEPSIAPLISENSPSDFEVLRTQINPISRIDISHKSCVDLVLPLHENHADFLSAKQILSADIEFPSALPSR